MFEPITVPRKVRPDKLKQTCPFTQVLDEYSVKAGREYLGKLRCYLEERFKDGYAVAELLSCRTYVIDKLLSGLYHHFNLSAFDNLALVAVGGYGRGELFPLSDIDILIVGDYDKLPLESTESIESLISFLWDLKLDVGSSVRTITECVLESRQDLTIKTNLLETRLICGSYYTYSKLLQKLAGDLYWDPLRFLNAKLHEQLDRHHSYKDSAYLLEPDIKNNPGGLRDIQIMQWIANFHFHAKTINDMLSLGLLSRSEFDELISCRDFLWETRCALHLSLTKEDDRLTLDMQKAVAKLLGFTGDGTLAVEKMMRTFFRSIRRVRELNSMALQLETLRITGHLGADSPVFINSYFIKRGPLIDIADPDIFNTDPDKMLEVFVVMAETPDILGLHVNCLRLLREARRSLHHYLIEIPKCRETFKRLLQNSPNLASAITLMHEHRVLSAYMPQWEKIEGLSQFDMFHTYTVDEHTIHVIKNIQELNQNKESKYSLFRNVYHQINEPELLNVAALLHDIGKGRGGHHADIGAHEAIYFCQLHDYTQYQNRIVSWLVQNHLTMSAIAMRRDITDPEVVNDFAKLVQDEEHLNLLYCLSVADIAATNDHEWNSWKESIFRQLYFATRQALRHGLEHPQDIALHVNENKQIALQYVSDIKESDVKELWNDFQQGYFIRFSPLELAWHARNIIKYPYTDTPLVLFAQHENVGTEMFIYQKRAPFDFAAVASVMALKKINIQSAQIVRTKKDHCLCSIKFQTKNGALIDNDRLHTLRKAIILGFERKPALPKGLEETNSLFKIPTVISFLKDSGDNHSNLEVSTLDRSGLLAKIGITLEACGCNILAARITTTGERADDFFTLTNKEGTALSQSLKDELTEELHKVLDQKSDSKN